MKSKIFLLISLQFLFCGCDEKPTNEIDLYQNEKKISTEDTSFSSVYAEIVEVNNGWGYNIYNLGKLIIHQESIPAIEGNKSFVSINEAKIIADMMVLKIKKGIMPPSISVEELDSLEIHR